MATVPDAGEQYHRLLPRYTPIFPEMNRTDGFRNCQPPGAFVAYWEISQPIPGSKHPASDLFPVSRERDPSGNDDSESGFSACPEQELAVRHVRSKPPPRPGDCGGSPGSSHGQNLIVDRKNLAGIKSIRRLTDAPSSNACHKCSCGQSSASVHQ